MTNEYYTRQQYMTDYCGKTEEEQKAIYRRYFGQFVNSGTISTVLYGIGKERLLASTDEHMNDIPLAMWDRLVPNLSGSSGFKKAGDYYTLANGVCLLKEAARQWLESVKAE